MVALFVNGEGMRGGAVHHNIAAYPFLGEFLTEERYRFFSVRDEFPGLAQVAEDGVSVPGEVYDVPLEVIGERFMPDEPPELELGVVAMADGSYALGVVLRREVVESDRHRDISGHGGWRAYLRSLV